MASPGATARAVPATLRTEAEPDTPPPRGVQRDGGDWRIETRGVSPAVLAQQLTQVFGYLNAAAWAWFHKAAALRGCWEGLSVQAVWLRSCEPSAWATPNRTADLPGEERSR